VKEQWLGGKIMTKRPTVHSKSAKPISRSRLRIAMGKWAFSFLRWCSWQIHTNKYASNRHSDEKLAFIYAAHNTPILRELKGIDMHLQYNKITNLTLACRKMNGIILKPGESFSFWKLVGKPSKRKGYLEGMVLVNGTVCSGTGGGLCQLSNLIYWMTIHTPLTITERWRHNYDVFPDSNRKQPFGSGATISYNYIDLQIKNNTPDPFQLLVWVEDTELYGEWRTINKPTLSYSVYESEHAIQPEWWGGYTRHNVLRRRVHNHLHNEDFDEYISDNHAIMMYEPLLPAGKTKTRGD
jgi:vancomycin resistance protein VanW